LGTRIISDILYDDERGKVKALGKTVASLGMAALLLCCGSIYAFANSSEAFSFGYKKHFLQRALEKAEKAVDEEIVLLGKATVQQMGALYENIGNRIDHLIWTSHSKRDLLNHQKAYLMQLQDAADRLKTKGFADYEKRTKEEISTDIEKEIEGFLADLLTE